MLNQRNLSVIKEVEFAVLFLEKMTGGIISYLFASRVLSKYMVMIGVNQHISFFVVTDGNFTFLVFLVTFLVLVILC